MNKSFCTNGNYKGLASRHMAKCLNDQENYIATLSDNVLIKACLIMKKITKDNFNNLKNDLPDGNVIYPNKFQDEEFADINYNR